MNACAGLRAGDRGLPVSDGPGPAAQPPFHPAAQHRHTAGPLLLCSVESKRQERIAVNLKCTTLVIMVGNVMVEADMEVEWCRLKIKVDFCSVKNKGEFLQRFTEAVSIVAAAAVVATHAVAVVLVGWGIGGGWLTMT